MKAYTQGIAIARTQRSHVLFVHSNARSSEEERFRRWYKGTFLSNLVAYDFMLGPQLYEQHAVDITRGKYQRPPFRYLAICDLCLDGADQAGALIDEIMAWHDAEATADDPATWLYYPVSERVGRSPPKPSMLTLAFANGTGDEAEFQEFYATRHIRHALHIEALVSGQCFRRTRFQKCGALPAAYQIIAAYEQIGSPQSIIESFASLPPGTIDFPMLDRSRFAEWVYVPLA